MTIRPVIVRKPSGPPRIELAGKDPQGRSASVACSTCHSVRKPNHENVSSESLDEFHKGMTFNHGKIACYACHTPGDADTLRLADGTAVNYENVMTLCSQCHSRQATAFDHGAHGGMGRCASVLAQTRRRHTASTQQLPTVVRGSVCLCARRCVRVCACVCVRARAHTSDRAHAYPCVCALTHARTHGRRGCIY